MAKCYFELRTNSARGTDSVAADMMRHLHARRRLGKAVVVCDQPISLLAACRKQWLKLGRLIQKQRSSTLNADKILKHTLTITHMQHMRFTSKTPLEDPDADIYFLSKNDLADLPRNCLSLYAYTVLNTPQVRAILKQLPADALIVDYDHSVSWDEFGLHAKIMLEQQVLREWDQVCKFLAGRNIIVSELIRGGMHNIEAMDDALDTLLGASNQFLRSANDFQHALELARPLRINKKAREEYDSLVLLAYRVQALSPGVFTQHFLESYNEDDTFFLYDVAKRRFVASGEPLADAVARHLAAGRRHLARSLQHSIV
ncbi:MAG: hypothetical protein ABWX94_03725 [Candidatus Saccharimonadales bacterium]